MQVDVMTLVLDMFSLAPDTSHLVFRFRIDQKLLNIVECLQICLSNNLTYDSNCARMGSSSWIRNSIMIYDDDHLFFFLLLHFGIYSRVILMFVSFILRPCFVIDESQFIFRH
jgi:hypothetical protein